MSVSDEVNIVSRFKSKEEYEAWKKFILFMLSIIFIFIASPSFSEEIKKEIVEDFCSEAWMLWRSERYDVLWNRSVLKSREDYTKATFAKTMESNPYIMNSFKRIEEKGCYAEATFTCKKPPCVKYGTIQPNEVKKVKEISLYFNKEKNQLELWLGDIIFGMP